MLSSDNVQATLLLFPVASPQGCTGWAKCHNCHPPATVWDALGYLDDQGSPRQPHCLYREEAMRLRPIGCVSPPTRPARVLRCPGRLPRSADARASGEINRHTRIRRNEHRSGLLATIGGRAGMLCQDPPTAIPEIQSKSQLPTEISNQSQPPTRRYFHPHAQRQAVWDEMSHHVQVR